MATIEKPDAVETSAQSARFHLSLNVEDLPPSVEFFTRLFDVSPAKLTTDYAKFEPAHLPLVLSLVPNRSPRGGKLNHLGFRLPTSEALVALQQRLEAHGIRTSREESVECCYSRQTKFWVTDPDGNLWELYTVDEDEDPRAPVASCAPQVVSIGAAPSLWAHRLGEPVPPRILAESGSVDEVLLEGTFNARLSPDERQALLIEAARVLKPGGRLTLYQLSARTGLANIAERLPGPAAIVEAVPTAAELVNKLEAAGLVDLWFEKLGDGHCFVVDGVECRETRLVAFKPPVDAERGTCQVVYKGPFRQIEDDGGNRFRRGEWTTVDAATRERLANGPMRDQFVLGDS
jgi:catechol 2,3-dioxygenase-like lactoylglutathione lyase family enzyme